MHKVAIIVLNWNRADDTIECLKSIQKIKASNVRLHNVVIDNASTDDSVERISDYVSNQLTTNYQLLTTKSNLGFAGGNNVGIKYALENGADYIVLLNNDTIVTSNLIEGLLKTFAEHPKVGAISPKIYFAKGFEFHKARYKKSDLGRVIWYAGGDMDWKNVYGSNHGVDEVDNGQFEEILKTDFTTGCCMVVPREVIEKVGMLDESYYLYMEDVDLCERIRKAGFEVLYTPYAYLWHKVSQSSGIGSDLNDYFITRNRLLFGLKYSPLRAKFALIRESFRFLLKGRKWQKMGVLDYYLKNFGKGSWRN